MGICYSYLSSINKIKITQQQTTDYLRSTWYINLAHLIHRQTRLTRLDLPDLPVLRVGRLLKPQRHGHKGRTMYYGFIVRDNRLFLSDCLIVYLTVEYLVGI